MAPLRQTINDSNASLTTLRDSYKDSKPTDEQQAEEKKLMDAVEAARKEQESIVAGYAANLPVIKQMIDLALLSNGLLQGRELSDFIRRSVDLLGK